MAARGRHTLALPLLALLAIALRFAARTFVGGSSPQVPQAVRPPVVSGATAMLAQRMTAKEKQAARAKAKQGVETNKDKKIEIWPVEIPEGVTVLHVEYGQEGGIFPQPGNQEVLEFYRTLQIRFGHKVRIIHNSSPALAEFSPTGTWRKGSFEVVDVGGKKLLYSKLSNGVSLVNGDQKYFNKWLDEVAEKCALA
uniref:Uncharacterized protein n=1 Tax=Alexandrium andersonii TaxID=327968 RepID=A0A7S2D7U0_9DINO|mmetsp:Transcript_48096/g.108978  ORF Transcript_48096/g.108978 Transcript_48096/m.108978 type:complete len:196 (+) Transcript_48096:66-653(+)